METNHAFLCGAVILAAGASRRMGRSKALLPWRSTTVIGHLIQVYRKQTDMLAVVCRPDDSPLHQVLDRCDLPPTHRILNADPVGDMFSSVRLALRWTGWPPEITHLILALVDQPQIQTGTISRLVEAARRHPASIIQPASDGRRHHPVLIPRFLADTIACDHSFSSLREALHHFRGSILPLPVNDPGLPIDLDTPADYSAAISSFSSNQNGFREI